MNLSITKRQVRDALGQGSDASVARFFEISTAAVAQWGLDTPIPARRALQAVVKRPDLFGALTEPAANDDIGPGAEEDGDGVTDSGVDVEGTQGAESKVHGPVSSAQPKAGATMIGTENQRAASGAVPNSLRRRTAADLLREELPHAFEGGARTCRDDDAEVR